MEIMHLTPNELAERWRVASHTLINWRRSGGGPKYLKIGQRILYSIEEVERFERDHEFKAVGEKANDAEGASCQSPSPI